MRNKPSETLPCGLLSAKSQYRLAWVPVAMLAVLICILSRQRGFNPDEFEAIKSAWKIFQGQRIYVDFFQHHHPFLYYLLTPLFSFFGETEHTIMAARTMVLLFTAGILTMTHEIARRLFDKYVAVVSVLFLGAVPIFVHMGIQVRPDVPQTFFGLLAVYFLIVYFDANRMRDLVLSALCLCMAFLFLQKALLLAGLIFGILVWRLIQGKFTLHGLLLYAAVLAAGWGIYIAYLAATGQLSEYLFFNFVFNAGKTDYHQYPLDRLRANISAANPVVLLCLACGVVSNRTREQYETAVLATGLLILAVVYPTQYQQYYLMSLPLIAVIAANGWVSLYRRYPRAGLIVLVAALLRPGAGYLNDLRHKGNVTQLATIRYVTEITSKDDYVYDGGIHFNLFRKDLDFFWYSVGEGQGLSVYRKLRGRYDYDIYALIEKYKPKVISGFAIEHMDDPRIRNHYRQSRRYETLYLRTG
jgi:4-amino-4-deoxy-L-arabinose transferase-like glycosyltransferase